MPKSATVALPPTLAKVAPMLLDWYDQGHRDLPWRRTQDPYRIWVSEIMLQQTRVQAVLEPYQRFLEAFPTLEVLAAASQEEVLAKWSGLGYYRRARLLHRGAQEVEKLWGGELPRSRREILKVPSIGPYTAGAILSIAFELPVGVVDGNVERVLTRVYCLEGDPKKGPLKKRLFELADGLVSSLRPGDTNQALMELGATVCLPQVPRCSGCPLAGICQAKEAGREVEFPQLAARLKPVPLDLVGVLVRGPQGILCRLRPETETWMPGLYEIPTLGFPDPERKRREAKTRRSEARHDLDELEALLWESLEAKFKGSLGPQGEAFEVSHGILHYKIRYRIQPATTARSKAPSGWKFLDLAALREKPLASLTRKVLDRSRG